MRSKVPLFESKSEPALPSAWPLYTGIGIAGLLLGTMLWPFWRGAGEGPRETAIASVCERWDDLARESVARLVQNGKHDADLRQAGDAIFRLRRARRNCDAGWITLACQDYLVVLRGTSVTVASRPPDQPRCTLAGVDEAGTTR